MLVDRLHRVGVGKVSDLLTLGDIGNQSTLGIVGNADLDGVAGGTVGDTLNGARLSNGVLVVTRNGVADLAEGNGRAITVGVEDLDLTIRCTLRHRSVTRSGQRQGVQTGDVRCVRGRRLNLKSLARTELDLCRVGVVSVHELGLSHLGTINLAFDRSAGRSVATRDVSLRDAVRCASRQVVNGDVLLVLE